MNVCSHILTKRSLLKYRWLSHTIQFCHLSKRSPRATSLSFIPRSERLQRAVPLPPLIAFCHPRNLRDFLVRASLTVTSQEPPGNHPCGAAGCKMCPILTATDKFTSHTIVQVFKINFTTSCKSSNIICLVTFRRCGQQYVGETGQLLYHTINGHRYNINHTSTKFPVALHFNGKRHTLADMTVVAIDN